MFVLPQQIDNEPPASALVAQLVLDFGVGPLLLAPPVLHTLRNMNETWEVPVLPVFVSGVLLVGIGWIIRRMTSSAVAHGRHVSVSGREVVTLGTHLSRCEPTARLCAWERLWTWRPRPGP